MFKTFRELVRNHVVSVISLIVSLVISLVAIYLFDRFNEQQKRVSIDKLSNSYVSLMTDKVFRALSATYPLAALVRTQKGDVSGFTELAAEMLPYYGGVASLQLAPDGVIQHIVPLAGNVEAIGHNLLLDKARNKEAFLARDSGELTLAGPFNLVQGGVAAAGRLPIYLEDEMGAEVFWGFAIVLIRFPEVLEAARLNELADAGIAYELSRMHPDTGKIQMISSSGGPLPVAPEQYPIKVPNGLWMFKVAPLNGWRSPALTFATVFLGLIFTALITLSASLIARMRDNKIQLEQTVLARTQTLNDNLKRLDLALSTSGQGWFDLDVPSGKLVVSDEYAKLLGYDPSEFSLDVDQWRQSVHPDDQQAVFEYYSERLTATGPGQMEYRSRTKDGGWLWIHSIGEVVEWDEAHQPLRVIGIHTDISQRKRSEQVLRTLAESGSTSDDDIFRLIVRQLASAYQASYVIIARIDPNQDGNLDTLAVWAGGSYLENFSCQMVHPEVRNLLQRQECYASDNFQNPFPIEHPFGKLVIQGFLGTPLINSRQRNIGLIAIFDEQPIKFVPQAADLKSSLAVRASMELERKESDDRLRLLSRVFKETHEGITITDVNGIIVDVNTTFCEATGYSRDEIIGQNPRILNSGQQGPEFYQEMWQTLAEKGYWQGEVWNRKKNGELYAELLNISSLKDEQGDVLYYVGLFSDITQSKELQRSLEQMAHYDVLTHLPNRLLFADRFSQSIAHSKRTDSLLAICFLDLDNFKPVNDQYGHQTGDQLLIQVAERIKVTIREEDTVSRLGGDEFALLLGNLDSCAMGEQMLQRIQHSLAQVFIIEDKVVKISASIGVTFYPLDDADPDTLMRHADHAMYEAKIAGRNHYCLYSVEKDEHAIQKHARLKEIQQALESQEFCLYYQPKVNMKTGLVLGVEALIRWQHPQKGLILPAEFLPLIDGTDIEIQIGQWVIGEALHQLNIWRKQGIAFEVSVNIASHHLLSPSFVDDLTAALAKHPDIDPSCLQLEILESSVLSDLRAINSVIGHCRDALGVSVALDDFGTDYSSLTHLRNLPANVIKIDKSFVIDMLDDPEDYAIIESVIGLSNSFNRGVIAEGVESVEHGLMLIVMGCEHAQGYGIARPMPADKISVWLQSYNINEDWIACGRVHRSTEKQRLKLLEITTVHWLKTLLYRMQSEPCFTQHQDNGNVESRHLQSWIRNERIKGLFSESWLDELEELYEKFVNQVEVLAELYQKGQLASAAQATEALHCGALSLLRFISPDEDFQSVFKSVL